MFDFMSRIQNPVYYCCVSKGNRILYAYNCGNHEIDKLVPLCLERVPPFHKWYFQTAAQRTFGFLVEDGYVYFAIADESVGNSGILRLLEHLRIESKRVMKKGSSRSTSNLNSICLQEQLVPVIHRLIASLEQVSRTGNERPNKIDPTHVGLALSPGDDVDGEIETSSSTKAPLLSKSGKHEKKKLKDHAIGMRDIEFELHQMSSDRGVKVDPGAIDSNNRSDGPPQTSLQKDLGSMRLRSGAQNPRKKWCRLLQIILAIDAAVCLVLFAIWLAVCRGLQCLN